MWKRRIASLGVALIMLLQCISITVFAADNVEFNVASYELVEDLYTINSEVAYGGEIESVEYSNNPEEGMQYLLVYVSVSIDLGSVVDLDNIQVQGLEEAEYDREIEDAFLSNHGYAQLEHGENAINSEGWILFQVPGSVTESELLENGVLSSDGMTVSFESSGTEDRGTDWVSAEYNGMVEEQQALEATYLAAVAAADYTAEAPYIIVNPYKIAPQSALIIFETEEAVSVTAIIEGKTEETTITNIMEEECIYHEIPLIGLYEGMNRVEIQLSDGSSYIYEIETAEISEDFTGIPTLEVLQQDTEQLSEGLYLLSDTRGTIVDINGDVRGYFTLTLSPSGIDELTEAGHIFVSMDSYTEYPTVLELDYMGKVYEEIQIPGEEVDHDAYLINENTLLLEEGYIDLENHTFVEYEIEWNEIFNDTGSFEIRNYGETDWLHFNTIDYAGDGYIFVSMRGQNAVAKLSYPEIEVIWVLSDNEEACLDDLDKYLIPEGDDFEWFYSQHDISLVLENEDGTIDITIFDNGMHRGSDPDAEYPQEEMYSRMVRYRIDEENMTVEQVWEWGEELGTDGLSYVHGSTQYIEESDTYLGNFDTLSSQTSGDVELPREKMTIVEVNSDGEVVLEFASDKLSYRVEKVSTDVLYQAWAGLGVEKGYYTYIGNEISEYDTTEEIVDEEVSYAINSITVTQNYIDIYGWVARTDALDTETMTRCLILTNIETGEAHSYFLANDSSQIEKSDATTEVIEMLDDSAGFGMKLLNISDLEDGTYSVSLQISQSEPKYILESIGLKLGQKDINYIVETEYTLTIGKYSEQVTNSDIIESQAEISSELLEVFESGDYTLTDPYVVVDAYGLSPLSAIAMFETSEEAQITVTVEGLDGGQTFENTYETMSISHTIPIYGLYSEEATNVILTATYADESTESYTIEVTGDKLPDGYATFDVSVADIEEMAEGLTFTTPVMGTYVSGADQDGTIRFLLSDMRLANTSSIEQLDSGNFLITSYTRRGDGYYRNSFIEIEPTGRIVNEYEIDGVHHAVIELPNGNFLAVGGDTDGTVVEDAIYEIDSETGEYLKIWDFDSYLPVTTTGEEGVRSSVETYDYDIHDWLHINSVDFYEETGEIIISGRQQNVVVSIDYETGEINYILSNEDIELPEALEDKLLSSIGDDFQWQYGQHDVQFMDNGDILLFDNGNYRSNYYDSGVDATENYSRAVIYHVDTDNMTVEQVWQYGEEYGSEYYCMYVSGVQCLGEEHYLINFGGQRKTSDGDAAGVFGGDGYAAFTQIEIKDGEVVYQADSIDTGVSANLYRAQRYDIYWSTEEIDLSVNGTRYGSLQSRGLAIISELPSSDVELSLIDTSVEDNGIQLIISTTVEEAGDEDEVYL